MSERVCLLALDVGGTHTRVAASLLVDGERREHPHLPEHLRRRVGDADELADLVREVVDRLRASSTPVRAALGVAGPRIGDSVTVTNWPEPRHIRSADLEEWGLPAATTRILNDVEAGAHGLLWLLGSRDLESDAFEALRGDLHGMPRQNLALVVPGTGLGCAGIVARPEQEGGGWTVVASEGGHVPAAPLDDDHAGLVDDLRRRHQGMAPSWEAFVSGEGLVAIHRYLTGARAAAGNDRGPTGADPAAATDGGPASADATPEAAAGEARESDPAAAIAAAARQASDPAAVRALDLYYRCVGRFAQSLALTFRAEGGVFIAGGSTRENLEFLRERSGLVDAFLANREQRELLETVPVWAVLEELNLTGALAVAEAL